MDLIVWYLGGSCIIYIFVVLRNCIYIIDILNYVNVDYKDVMIK